MNYSSLEHLYRVFKTFDQEKAKVIVIGGAAVALHGHYRRSTGATGLPSEVPDLDFWYKPSLHNFFAYSKRWSG